MALDVLVSPGCADVSDEYLDRALGPSDVLIDVGEIFRAVTRSDAIPNTRPEALRLASALQITAIRFARENNLNGIVRTGNAARSNIDKLQTASGGASRCYSSTERPRVNASARWYGAMHARRRVRRGSRDSLTGTTRSQ